MADYMRGLGFFPSDYEIECLHHELKICGKRKIPFEDLLKLFVNHSPSSSTSETWKKLLENALKHLLGSPTADVVVKKSQLIALLTESAEKIDEKDAEIYVKEVFRSLNGKFVEEIPLSEFAFQVTTTVENYNMNYLA